MELYDLNDTLTLCLLSGPKYRGDREITHGSTNVVLTPGKASIDYSISFLFAIEDWGETGSPYVTCGQTSIPIVVEALALSSPLTYTLILNILQN